MIQKKLLFFDIESTPKKENSINTIWAVDNSGVKVYEWKDLNDFCIVANSFEFVVWHNIINHDLVYLSKEKRVDIKFFEKPVIDTLWLSALLFIKKPYHWLVKDYKLRKLALNDPVKDSLECKKLFDDEVWYFTKLFDPVTKNIMYNLLKNRIEFKGFFEYIKATNQTDIVDRDDKILNEKIKELLDWYICEDIDFPQYFKHSPIELAYVIRYLEIKKDKTDSSVLPWWIIKNIPKVNDMLKNIKKPKCGSCIYCIREGSIETKLKQYFWFDKFRDFFGTGWEKVSQREVILCALEWNNLLAIFPTWWWKSITFQLPALIEAELYNSVTLIVSPLQSLMKDQVDNLQKKFNITNVWYLNWLLNSLERKEVLEKLQFGWIDILYISPESLRSNTTKSVLSNRNIWRVVIDEAHCFSKWGHDFRTDYMFIADFIKEISNLNNKSVGDIKISCFTATAKQSVIIDIKNYFQSNLWLNLQEFKASIVRDNLDYEVLTIKDESERFETFVDLLENKVKNQVCIIFVRTRKKAENLSENINKYGYESVFYHGWMEQNAKRQIQDDFISWNVNIIVATNAFGMWVDKKDVRFVIHYEISSSIENYIQEAWRAGRDQQQSHCIVLFQNDDLDKNFKLIKQSEINKKEIVSIINPIKKHSKNSMHISAKELAVKSNWDTQIQDLETKIKTTLFLLEKRSFIKRGFNKTRVFVTSKEIKSLPEWFQKIDQIPELDTNNKQHAKEILKNVFTSNHLKIEDLYYQLWITKNEVFRILTILKTHRLLSQNNDLTCSLNIHGERKNQSINYLAVNQSIFQHLFEIFEENYNGLKTLHMLSAKKINEKISKALKRSTLKQEIENILYYMWSERYIKTVWEELLFLKELDAIKKEIYMLIGQCKELLEYLFMKVWKNQAQNKDVSVELSFSTILTHLKSKYAWVDIAAIEKMLLFLHKISIIRVDNWLFVHYTSFDIEKSDRINDKFTNDDFEVLSDYYEEKVRQIHILWEFIERIAKDFSSQNFADDYFNMDYKVFLEKYFKWKKWIIQQSITQEKFKQLFATLSTEQLDIINSKANSIVIAWPWAGKTRVLVHKVASIIFMEWVKTKQFLMLTFSRSAKFEIKERIIKLVWSAWYWLQIDTYHSFAFKYMWLEWNIENKRIIPECTKAILESDTQLPYSVILLDEFQDINDEQFDLVKAIVRKSSWDEQVRIIAAWDDDQNIYEFQWSNIKYIRNFEAQFQANRYILSKNYRSTGKIVGYSWQFIEKSENRVKNDTKLVSAVEDNLFLSWIIKAISVKSNANMNYTAYLLTIMEELASSEDVWILCFTNEKALEIQSLLDKNWFETEIILSKSKYKFHHILEVNYFLSLLTESELTKDTLREKYRETRDKYWNNKNIKKLWLFLNKYLTTNRRYFVDTLHDFVYWAKEDDILEGKRIKISTLHQAKWREFESVILYFDEDFQEKYHNDEQRRLIYVWLTRAKNNLILLWNSKFEYFNELYSIFDEKKEENIWDISTEKQLNIITWLDDINIWWNKDKFIRKHIAIWQKVDLHEDWWFKHHDKIIQTLSKKWISNMSKYISKWYVVKQISVYQRLVYGIDWKDVVVYLFVFGMVQGMAEE